MTYRLVFHPLIEADVRDGMARYEASSPGLGGRFKRTFYATVDSLLSFPEKQAVKVGGEIRTRLMRPFPYLVFYAIESGVVFVLTVQYVGRRPAFLRAMAQGRRAN